MAEWKAKRFWKQAEAVADGDTWGVALDGRRVRTPAKALLQVPTRALACEIATEWDRQQEQIDPEAMPLTRAANSAVDKVAPQFTAVADMLTEYGATDLCCYRADGPAPLIAEQADAWDPLLDWLRQAHGAPLRVTVGVVPVAQPDAAIERLRARLHGLDIFQLTAMHDLVTISGSLVIGLAALEGVWPAEELWRRSRVDETWQERQWGVDEEAAIQAAHKREAFLNAHRFQILSRTSA